MKMKGLLMVCGAVILFQMSASAQLKLRTEFGIKGGLNVSGLALSTSGKLVGAKYNSLTSFHGGAYALLRIGKLGIQPELIYSRQGQIYNSPGYTSLRTDLTYINVPIMIKYYLVGGLNLQAGPQFGFLASAKGDLVQLSGGNPGQALLNQDLKSFLNSSDFSFGFGAGLDLPLGINMGIRYNIGLSNINKYTGGQTNTPSFSVASTHNQVLQLSLGYRFLKIGK
jgi:hypothetical protein